MSQRYSSGMVTRARELRGLDWPLTKIASILTDEFGSAPSCSTISTWVDERAAVRRRRSDLRRKLKRDAERSGGRLAGNFKSPELRIRRIKGLAEAGLSNEAIAKVMMFDFPDTPLTRYQVEGVVRDGRIPWALRAMA